jgi:hypothetical protein
MVDLVIFDTTYCELSDPHSIRRCPFNVSAPCKDFLTGGLASPPIRRDEFYKEKMTRETVSDDKKNEKQMWNKLEMKPSKFLGKASEQVGVVVNPGK